MKIAVIQDQLLTKAGSERVFKYMVQEFKEADIYTLAYNPNSTLPFYKTKQIRTSFVNAFIKTHEIFKTFFPISTYIMQCWDFSKYDVILTSSATTAKYIRRFKGIHICYCYFPTRAIWDNEKYFRNKRSLKILIFYLLLPFFKKRDIYSTTKISKMISISKYSQKAIQRIYNCDSEVLFSPIDYELLKQGFSVNKKSHYLIVSRLEKWKDLEYAIHAFNESGKKLKVIGTGAYENYLKSISNSNIKFLGSVSDERLAIEYGEARALIFTPELEYGLTPIEANAAGTLTIAYGRGGVKETMIPFRTSSDRNFTAIFFQNKNFESLNDAVRLCEQIEYSPSFLKMHAKKFSIKNFQKRLRQIIEEEYTRSEGKNPK